MSTRANSLRTVVVDGLSFAAAMGLIGALTTTLAAGAEPVVERVADAADDRRLTDDHIDSQLNTDDNMPSGDPTESAAEERETNILGMKLLEERPGVARVADVTAASPAWDAGIRRGDRLLSVDGVRIRKLARWVEDMAKLLDDKQDGHAVAAVVERDGENLDLRIRLLVSKAGQARDAEQADRAIAEAAAAGQQQQPVQQPPGGGQFDNTDPYYDGQPGYGGGIGGFFAGGNAGETEPGDNGDDRMANRAIAHLAAVNNIGSGSRGQIGIAAFRTNGQGTAAMVTVRGLPQGSYLVGIDQGGALTGGFGGEVSDGGAVGFDPRFGDPNVQGDEGLRDDGRRVNERNRNNLRRNDLDRNGRPMNDPRMQNQQNQQPMPGEQPTQQTPMPAPGQPSLPQGPAAGGAAPADGAGGAAPAGDEGASLANPRGPSYLAQQLDAAPVPQGQAPRPGGQAVQPGAVPGQDRNMPNENIRNPGQDPSFPGDNQNRQPNDRFSDQGAVPFPAGSTAYGGAGAPQFLREIGILQVGPDGSGQVQTQLDGIAVRNLAGLNVTVVATMSQGGGGYGPPQQGTDPRVNQNPTNNQRALPQTSQQRAANSAAAANPDLQSAPGVVATGVIQLMEGRGGTGIGEAPRGRFLEEERPVDEATQEQRQRSQISDPRQDLDFSR